MATPLTRTTTFPWLRYVRQADETYEKDKRVEPQYRFNGGKRIFYAVTNSSGPYSA